MGWYVPSNRNGVVLCGISGSGKTQLVHEYILREREKFSAILWLNADSEMGAEQSFGACASRICHEIPEFRDREEHISSRDIVFDWLRMTPHRNWLVVVDGADDLILNRRFFESLNRLHHGAICVTSTHPGAARAVHVKQISVERLDPAASQSLILWRALGSEQNPGNEGKLSQASNTQKWEEIGETIFSIVELSDLNAQGDTFNYCLSEFSMLS
ncbi:hypothetical protein DER44DRAFT_752968 [Fusarium oxysporum]|nr:hypothetical protein DER44DRAFT_752968 [Fusarium oxysporum]